MPALSPNKPLSWTTRTRPGRDSSRYIQPAKAAGFKINGYYFQPQVEACQERNENRPEHQVIPFGGLLAKYSKLEVPCVDEGFDELYSVQIGADGAFVVEVLG